MHMNDIVIIVVARVVSSSPSCFLLSLHATGYPVTIVCIQIVSRYAYQYAYAYNCVVVGLDLSSTTRVLFILKLFIRDPTIQSGPKIDQTMQTDDAAGMISVVYSHFSTPLIAKTDANVGLTGSGMLCHCSKQSICMNRQHCLQNVWTRSSPILHGDVL